MSERHIRAICFDVGETLIDETRFWSEVARYAGVPEFTLAGTIGGLIERRESHRSIFGYLQIESVDTNVVGYRVERTDLYPDVDRTIDELQAQRYRIAIAGNQGEGVDEQIASLDLGAEVIGTSGLWGAAKPDPAFFQRVCDELNLQPGQIVLVGDRLDNDVLPAMEFGMQAVHIRRGPWGIIQAGWPESGQVRWKIDRLGQLCDTLECIEEAISDDA
ncbi:MAG TPA: HAD family hydrolase [Thermomicrobiales bacterium]|nr:HAD family hydrolase [Thermomicrobiales bacterium]